jgi:pyruvate kinase
MDNVDRRTKIVVTIGPTSCEEIILRELFRAGADVVRLNFSHGEREEHATVIKRVRKIADEEKRPICILQDLQGPKIRIGELAGGSVSLLAGQLVTLTIENKIGNHKEIPVDYEELPSSVQSGGRILLDDGHLELIVNSIGKKSVNARVVIGGELKQNKGVNLPGVRLDIPSLTEKDRQDLRFGLEHGVDCIALSFVRSAVDIQQLRDEIGRLNPEKIKIPIIAKLERAEALDNLDEIVHSSEGVMVARGDLGVEMSPDEVPIAQKCIIETSNRHGKVVITATQMLESMINNPRPTRAEASDVANAILDGTDAVMLSGETAIGKYPIKTVEMMSSIICTAESNMLKWGHHVDPREHDTEYDDTFYMTLAARELAHDRNVAAVAVFTKSGRTALLMSKSRPRTPILAFTPDPQTYPRLSMFWGVKPYLVSHATTIDEMLNEVDNVMMTSESITPGQQVVLICGFPVDEVRPTNLALIHTVGQKP